MNRLLTISIFVLALTLGFLANAQPREPFEPPANPKRYWIIAEKTTSAEPYKTAIRQAVFDLVYHGAGGEMTDGSVFEIWIYGADTKIRGFEPQMLLPDNHREVAMKASQYVNDAEVAGSGDMPQFAEHVRKMASVVFETTIFFVSAPTTRLNGTSVDSQVNKVFDVHGQRMSDEGRPFITTFRIQDGQLASYAISESARSLALPPMPESKVTPEERQQMIADARRKLDEEETARLEKIAEAERKKLEAAEAEARRLAAIERAKPDEEREGAIILRGTPKTQNQTPPEETKPVEPEPVIEEIVEEPPPVEPKPTPEPEPEPEPEVLKPDTVAEEPVQVAMNEVESAQETESVESTDVEESESADAESAEPIVAAEPAAWFTAGGLVVVGLLFFGVAGVLVWIALRRTRSTSQASAITQSMRGDGVHRK